MTTETIAYFHYFNLSICIYGGNELRGVVVQPASRIITFATKTGAEILGTYMARGVEAVLVEKLQVCCGVGGARLEVEEGRYVANLAVL